MGSASGESAPSIGGLWQGRPMVVTVHETGGATTTVSVDKPFARVGRDRRAEVHLGGPNVLPCQLYLHATDDGIYCLSLSADASSGWLTAGSKIRVGDHRLSAAFADTPLERAALPDLCARQSAAGPVPLITVAAGRQQIAIRDVVVHRQLTLIGRQPPGTLCVRHRTISRAHCVLYWDGRRLWLVDLLSSNGTRLDGERFDAGTVPQGGTFRLGDIRFHFVTTTPLDRDRSPSDSGAGLLDVPEDSDLLPGIPAEATHEFEAVHGANFDVHPGAAAVEKRFQDLESRLRQHDDERARLEQTLAARETIEATQAKQLAELEMKQAEAVSAAQRDRELLLAEAADREAQLAALRQSLASLEEKLARTEAQLAASKIQPTEAPEASAAWQERFQELAERLDQQHQQQHEERDALAKKLATGEATESKQAKQLAALEAKLSDALSAAQQERELLLGETADREAHLAALRKSLTSLEEKLARTEARLAASSAQAVDDRQAAATWEQRFQELAERLERHSSERAAQDEKLAAREAAEAKQTTRLAELETSLASALNAAKQERESLIDALAEREAQLAALHQSLSSLEKKLERTEAQLASASIHQADERQTAAAWEQRFQDLEQRLLWQREERTRSDVAPSHEETVDDARAWQSLASLEERILQTEAKLTALAEQANATAGPTVVRDAVRAAAPAGEWMLDDEHTRRLLAFRHKREGKRRWRQVAWGAAILLVVIAGAVATTHYLNNRNQSAANRPPAPDMDHAGARLEP